MPKTPPTLTQEDTLVIARDTLRDVLAIVKEMKEEIAEFERRLDALEARDG